MSLSLREELRIVLRPNQVQVVRIGRELSLRGITQHVLDKKIYPCAADSNLPWNNAVKALQSALTTLPIKPATAQVVLSNQFTRYAMIPASQTLSNEAEETAYAKHIFSQLYGTSAESWEIRLHQGTAGAAQLASAIDGQLLHELRALFTAENIKLKSVRPQLMAAYNNCRVQIQQQDAWFVVAEQESLCLGLLQQGQWRSVRALKVGSDWLEKLPDLLDREVFLSEVEASSDEIYLWAPEHWRTALPKTPKWNIHKLQPAIRADFAPSYEERFATAML